MMSCNKRAEQDISSLSLGAQGHVFYNSDFFLLHHNTIVRTGRYYSWDPGNNHIREKKGGKTKAAARIIISENLFWKHTVFEAASPVLTHILTAVSYEPILIDCQHTPDRFEP
ncbi:hypothetical protein TWF706_009336 [Orbilia oligospora]|nr:hypothetical protein TWF706_009336 [Orbilia oligospora]